MHATRTASVACLAARGILVTLQAFADTMGLKVSLCCNGNRCAARRAAQAGPRGDCTGAGLADIPVCAPSQR